jgi:hypothetical protein
MLSKRFLKPKTFTKLLRQTYLNVNRRQAVRQKFIKDYKDSPSALGGKAPSR